MSLENRRPFQEFFTASGDVAAVTWSDLMERLKGMEHGVNLKADS